MYAFNVRFDKSSFKKLFEIDRDYMVYTGHGDITSFLYEKRNNPIFLSE